VQRTTENTISRKSRASFNCTPVYSTLQPAQSIRRKDHSGVRPAIRDLSLRPVSRSALPPRTSAAAGARRRSQANRPTATSDRDPYLADRGVTRDDLATDRRDRLDRKRSATISGRRRPKSSVSCVGLVDRRPETITARRRDKRTNERTRGRSLYVPPASVDR